MNEKQQHFETLKNIFENKQTENEMSFEDYANAFHNFIALAYANSDDPKLRQQMMANSAILIGAGCDSHNFKVHIDTKPKNGFDYDVNVEALPDDKA